MQQLEHSDLVRRFEDAANQPDAERRAEAECVLRQGLRAVGVSVTEVVEAQTEDALAVAVRGGFFGDEAAGELCVRLEIKLRSGLVRLGATHDDAFDAVQEVVVLLLSHRLKGFDPARASVSTYLWVVARNRWFRLLGGRRRERPYADGREDVGREASPEDDAIATETEGRLAQARDQLSAGDREIADLLAGGATYQDLARHDGIPPATAASRCSRMRARLAEYAGIDLPPPTRGRPRKRPAAEPTSDLPTDPEPLGDS